MANIHRNNIVTVNRPDENGDYTEPAYDGPIVDAAAYLENGTYAAAATDDDGETIPGVLTVNSADSANFAADPS